MERRGVAGRNEDGDPNAAKCPLVCGTNGAHCDAHDSSNYRAVPMPGMSRSIMIRFNWEHSDRWRRRSCQEAADFGEFNGQIGPLRYGYGQIGPWIQVCASWTGSTQ